MARIHLVIGPVGSGKSTFVSQLCREHRGIRLILDEWMTRLFRKDRPEVGLVEWYVERAARCVDQIWQITEDLLEVGMDVVLEIGLVQRSVRQDFYGRVDAKGHALTVYVVDAEREVRRRRVEERNLVKGETFSMEVPPHIFELASDMWQPPDDAEREAREMRFIYTD